MDVVPCRACGEMVVWVHTDPGGSDMPLDAAPTVDGQWMLVGTAAPGRSVSVLLPRAVAVAGSPPLDRYTGHASTCAAIAGRAGG